MLNRIVITEKNQIVTLKVVNEFRQVDVKPALHALENNSALNAKTYDTSLGYTGAVTYSGNNGTYWCYFDQIEDNLTEKEKSDVDVQINLENEWWK